MAGDDGTGGRGDERQRREGTGDTPGRIGHDDLEGTDVGGEHWQEGERGVTRTGNDDAIFPPLVGRRWGATRGHGERGTAADDRNLRAGLAGDHRCGRHLDGAERDGGSGGAGATGGVADDDVVVADVGRSDARQRENVARGPGKREVFLEPLVGERTGAGGDNGERERATRNDRAARRRLGDDGRRDHDDGPGDGKRARDVGGGVEGVASGLRSAHAHDTSAGDEEGGAGEGGRAADDGKRDRGPGASRRYERERSDRGRLIGDRWKIDALVPFRRGEGKISRRRQVVG